MGSVLDLQGLTSLGLVYSLTGTNTDADAKADVNVECRRRLMRT